MAEIDTPEKLREWLEKQPREIAQAIAVRIALRIFPKVWPIKRNRWRFDVASSAVRALFISWSSVRYSGYPTSLYAFESAKEIRRTAELFNTASFDNFSYAALIIMARASEAVSKLGDLTYGIILNTYSNEFYSNSDIAAVISDVKWLNEAYYLYKYSVVLDKFISLPLWLNEKIPKPYSEMWSRMEAAFSEVGGDWDIWLDWYKNRLSGQSYAFSILPRADHATIAEIATEENAFWERPPANVNADIKARLLAVAAELPSDTEDTLQSIPEQKRAPLETFIRDGRIARKTPARPANTQEEREARRRSGREALVESLDDFQEAFPNHNHRGLTQSLSRLRNALGSGIEDIDLIRTAIAAERIQQFALRAEDVCSTEMTAEVVSLNITLQQELAHFDEVRSYRDELMRDEPVSAELQKAELQVAHAMIGHEALEPETSDVLGELTSYAEEEVEAGKNDSLIYHSFARSVENALATIIKDVVKYHASLIQDGYQKGVKLVATGGTVALLTAIPLSVLNALGVQLTWLVPVLKFLGMLG